MNLIEAVHQTLSFIISTFSIFNNFVLKVEAAGGAAGAADIHIGSLIKTALLFLGGLALVFGLVLALIARFFHTQTNPKVEQVEELLAHAHCGACGFAGCAQYAEAVVNNPDTAPDLCTPAGPGAAAMIADLTGKKAKPKEAMVAYVFCGGDSTIAKKKFTQTGVKDCTAATFIAGGDKDCPYGCLGYGTCAKSCPFGGITMSDKGLPVIDPEKCVACGKCVKACPKKIISIVPRQGSYFVRCRSLDKGPTVKKYCTIGCIGCGLCVKNCPSEAIVLEQNLAKIDPKKCTSCGTCAQKCPTKAIVKL